MATSISIIIPSGPKEKALLSLWDRLAKLGNDIEIIVVHNEESDPEFWTNIRRELDGKLSEKNVHWISSGLGRGQQLNAGAAQAKGSFLWFLHADSILEKNTFISLKTAIKNHPRALHYFTLAFSNDGPAFLMKVNEIFVHFRSKLLGSPFGDQGFCIHKTLFDLVGGYPENLPYGEDHVFVWRVRQAGIPILSISKKLFTSARKYQKNGWVKTTFIHNKLWMKQVIPEAKIYLQSRGVI